MQQEWRGGQGWARGKDEAVMRACQAWVDQGHTLCVYRWERMNRWGMQMSDGWVKTGHAVCSAHRWG